MTELRAAVVDPATGAVINIIMADAAIDASPVPNTILVDAGDLPITSDWRWSESDGWISPPVPPPPPPPESPSVPGMTVV